LGGTSNLWAGWCRPFQPEDFEVRSWVPNSGWPIGFDDLAPYYDAATAWAQVSPFPGADAWAQSTRPTLDLDPERLETRIWQFSSPTRFGTTYLPDIEASEDVELALDANIVGLRMDGSTIEEVQLSTLSGKRFSARGRAVVLACGGIENARLLLAFGLGSDATGRFFMEHPLTLNAMELQLSAEELSLYSERAADEVVGKTCMGLFALPAALQASEGLLNQAVMWRDVGNVQQDSTSKAVGAWLTHTTGRASLAGMAMGIAEQVPHPDSRITLLSSTDVFGIPRVHLDWRLQPQDWRSLVRGMELTADALAAAGYGRGQVALDVGDPWSPLSWGAHHMGTTRMARSDDDGVVDENLRVFGVDNLYVAGSSVFTTGGAANPTLTILALSLRLADHLEEVL
jgi:choline dehydrogenase-like flavoprotein